MRQCEELEGEVVSGQRVSVLLRLVDIAPDLGYVLEERLLKQLSVVLLLVKVSQYEEQLFGLRLAEKLQVNFEDHREQAVVRSAITTYVSGPEVYDQHVGNCQSE